MSLISVLPLSPRKEVPECRGASLGAVDPAPNPPPVHTGRHGARGPDDAHLKPQRAAGEFRDRGRTERRPWPDPRGRSFCPSSGRDRWLPSCAAGSVFIWRDGPALAEAPPSGERGPFYQNLRPVQLVPFG